jgi:sugar phosphate isomerase/epimerase
MSQSHFIAPPLSLCHQSFIMEPPLKLIDIAVAAGFSSVGLRTHPSAPGGPAYSIKNGSPAAVSLKHRIEDTGVSAFCIETFVIDGNTDIRAFRPFLEDGAAIGVKRVLTNAASTDFALVAEKLAQLCEFAAGLDLVVELEFMPFRAVRNVEEACDVVQRSRAKNCQVLIDALHFSRSGGTPVQLSKVPRSLVGTFHICDAPRAAPPELTFEARLDRLLPGDGDLLIGDMLDNLPSDVPLGVEIPLRNVNGTPEELATRMKKASVKLLEGRRHRRKTVAPNSMGAR